MAKLMKRLPDPINTEEPFSKKIKSSGTIPPAMTPLPEDSSLESILCDNNSNVSSCSDSAKKSLPRPEQNTTLRKPATPISYQEFKTLTLEEKQQRSVEILGNALAIVTYSRSYARIKEDGSRECWLETVDRYVEYMRYKCGDRLSDKKYAKCFEYIANLKVLPSMRLLQGAGKAVEANNLAAYNCSFLVVDCLEAFSELMFISMSGVGAGFSVMKEHVNKLPPINSQDGSKKTFVIPDTTEGWCDALKIGIQAWYDGSDVEFDYSKIRPKGSVLKTKGGFASGPEPLVELLGFVRKIILENQGTRLTPLNALDIMCKIAEKVISGGNRRSALISFSDLDDEEIAKCKSGTQWHTTDPQRFKSNNSVIHVKAPTEEEIRKEFDIMVNSGSGERGICNMAAIAERLPERRRKLWERLGILDPETGKLLLNIVGGNPCMEIILLLCQLCNLTEVVARWYDTRESLLEKIKIASLLGTFQASLTNFHYLRDEWKKNCDLEALLGVSITGQKDCPILISNGPLYEELKDAAVRANAKYAPKIGVNQASSVTCTKPSGTAGILATATSGIKYPFSEYYVRRVRFSVTDPLVDLIKKHKLLPIDPEMYQINSGTTLDTMVVSFAMCSPCIQSGWDIDHPDWAPHGDLFNKSAIEQLEDFLLVSENFTEHNVSLTVNMKPHEISETKDFVVEHFDRIRGVAFLTESNHYLQMPLEKITREQYLELKSRENLDGNYHLLCETPLRHSASQQSWACSGDSCELIVS